MVDMQAPPEKAEKAEKAAATKAAKEAKAAAAKNKKNKGPAKVTTDDRGNEIVLSVYDWPDPVKPSAMLLPRIIRDRRANAKTRKIATVSVAVSIAIIAVLAITAGTLAAKAGSEKNTAQQALTAAEAEIEQYSGIAAYANGISERTTALATELATDIRFSQFIKTIEDIVPADITIGTIEFLEGSPCASPDPFQAVPSIGCLKINGLAEDQNSPSEFLSRMQQLPESANLILPYLVSFSVDTDGYSFLLTVNYTPTAISNRFQIGTPATAAGTAPGTAPAPSAAPSAGSTDPALSQNPSLQNPSAFSSAQEQAQNLVESTR